MAKADQKDACTQMPARGDREMLAVVLLKDPAPGRTRGFIPQTQLLGATAVVPHYYTVSRVMATMAVRWLKIPRVRHLDDFGTDAAESAIQDALQAFTAMNDSLGCELKIDKSEWGAMLEFLA